jgi:hypothetical protein
VGVAAAAAAEVRRKRRRSSMGAISVPGKFVSEAIRWRCALLQFFQVDRVRSSDKRGNVPGNETWNAYLEDKFLLANDSSPILQFRTVKAFSEHLWGAVIDVSGEFSGISLSEWERDATVCELGGANDGKDGGQVNEFFGVVTDIREESRVAGRQRWQMALDQTEFSAGDVGMLEAVARSGAKLVVPVLGVVIDAAGEVWHVVEKPLAAGTRVTGRVSQ